MAKKDKESKKSSKEDKDEEKTSEFKYGVQDIADELDIKPASVRVQLRNKGIEKSGKSYGWNSKSELKEVIDQLRSKDSDDDDDDDKPAKKSKKDKTEKSSKKDKKKDKSSKKSKKDD